MLKRTWKEELEFIRGTYGESSQPCAFPMEVGGAAEGAIFLFLFFFLSFSVETTPTHTNPSPKTLRINPLPGVYVLRLIPVYRAHTAYGVHKLTFDVLC
jgi:hypothetical protein